MSHFTHHYEENYLKAIFKLGQKPVRKVNNIALARYLELNPASVLEMVRKMAERGLVAVQADKSIQLTPEGERQALGIIRRHRLWEVFLVQKLQFQWHEVHSLAEQLEHVNSDELTDRLDEFLGHPPYDPHGDPIPDRYGRLQPTRTIPLADAPAGKSYIIGSFAETDDAFLDHLGKLQLLPGTRVKLAERHAYDQSCSIIVKKSTLHLSEKVARNILVRPS
jgi:DtxR family Mn-dependent transcriptional regulator